MLLLDVHNILLTYVNRSFRIYIQGKGRNNSLSYFPQKALMHVSHIAVQMLFNPFLHLLPILFPNHPDHQLGEAEDAAVFQCFALDHDRRPQHQRAVFILEIYKEVCILAQGRILAQWHPIRRSWIFCVYSPINCKLMYDSNFRFLYIH